MRFLSRIMPHISIVLSLCFLTFLVLDGYNPMMNFVDNDISHGMLWVLCGASLFSSIACVVFDRKCEKYQSQDASRFDNAKRRKRKGDFSNIETSSAAPQPQQSARPQQQGGYRPTGAEYGLQDNVSRTVHREVYPFPYRNPDGKDMDDDF